METQKHCQNCQAPLAANAPQGLCPACLMKVAIATGTGAGQEKSGFTPPGIEELASKFPQLEIIELIGRGGMGAVYKARQKELDRIVALKILPPGIGDEAAFAERFAREAKALARLNHPGIITIHDFGRADGLYFFVMEFVDGVNLRQLLASSRVSPREALAIVPQICDALQFAHDQGIVHRDIKPENILLDRRGRVKVADFGLAKLVGTDASGVLLTRPAGTLSPAGGEGRGAGEPPGLTDLGKVMGTPNYMAPEQVEHPADVDHRADIYALGVVFYQMLTGELPGKSLEPPSKKVHIDVRLDEIVLRALEKKPELRYQQASVLKTEVETIVATPPSNSRREAQPDEAKARQDWWTWSPLQSQEVGEICSHLTKAERNHFSVLGLLFAAWIPGTCFGIMALIRADFGMGKWIVAAVWLILFAVSIPMLQRMVRHFLCSTTWAKDRGFTPEQLRLFSFRRGNLWKGCAVLVIGLGLVFAQHKAIISYLGLGNYAQLNQIPERQPKKADVATNVNGTSVETWSPTVAPGEKPAVDKIWSDAKDLMEAGKYEDALQRHLWYHHHALEYDPGQTGVRLSFALAQWIELGRRYPKAKQALVEICDVDARLLADGHGYVNLFADVKSINDYLGQEDATYELFKTLVTKDPKLAEQCYFYAESLLVGKGEYQLCRKYMGDPQQRFDLIKSGRKMAMDNHKRMVGTQERLAEINRQHGITNQWLPLDTSAIMEKSANDRFVSQTGELIEVLVATGSKADAEKIHDQAMTILDDTRLRSAVTDAERKIMTKRP